MADVDVGLTKGTTARSVHGMPYETSRDGVERIESGRTLQEGGQADKFDCMLDFAKEFTQIISIEEETFSYTTKKRSKQAYLHHQASYCFGDLSPC